MAKAGILVVDKPEGPTSHGVVETVRRLLGERRIGHTGTLDPAATGVLVLCVGEATRLAEYLTARDKRYDAVVRFGAATDTDDAEGRVVAQAPVAFSREDLEGALCAFVGRIQQRPPRFSAIHAAGERAHVKARRGEDVALPPRPVEIHEIRVLECTPPDARLAVHCGPGTYVRSLARDLGEALGTRAHLARLRRTASGSLGVERAITLSELERAAAEGTWREHLVSMADALADWPAVTLDARALLAVRQGRPIETPPSDGSATPPLWRGLTEAGALAAVLVHDPISGSLRPRKVLRSTSEG